MRLDMVHYPRRCSRSEGAKETLSVALTICHPHDIIELRKRKSNPAACTIFSRGLMLELLNNCIIDTLQHRRRHIVGILPFIFTLISPCCNVFVVLGLFDVIFLALVAVIQLNTGASLAVGRPGNLEHLMWDEFPRLLRWLLLLSWGGRGVLQTKLNFPSPFATKKIQTKPNRETIAHNRTRWKNNKTKDFTRRRDSVPQKMEVQREMETLEMCTVA